MHHRRVRFYATLLPMAKVGCLEQDVGLVAQQQHHVSTTLVVERCRQADLAIELGPRLDTVDVHEASNESELELVAGSRRDGFHRAR